MTPSHLYPTMKTTNTALVVIDFINSCAHEKCEIPEWNIHFSKIRAMAPKMNAFLNDYRERINENVILVKTTPWQPEYLPENLNELYQHNPAARYYTQDKSGFAEEFYSIKPQSTDTIFEKNTYDAFADGKLSKTLEDKGVKYLIITGIFGDGCVMASINGAFSAGFRLVILEDLIETTDKENRQAMLSALKADTWPLMYGHTQPSDEFLKLWRDKKLTHKT